MKRKLFLGVPLIGDGHGEFDWVCYAVMSIAFALSIILPALSMPE